MNIEYLSHHEAASFQNMIHEDTDLANIFGDFIVQMEVDTDYDTVLISFDDERVLRIAIEDSPYVVVMDEDSQSIELYTREDDDELELDGEYDFDEEGVETVVDLIGSRILTEDSDGF